MLSIVFFEKFSDAELDKLLSIIQSVKADRAERHPSAISETNVSVRCKNVLRRNNIYCWHELSEFTQWQLKRLYSLGSRTLFEIEQQMKLRNISLKKG